MYTPLFSRLEAYRINQLIGQALGEPELQYRLLNHDPRLIVEFTLPQRVWQVITCIQSTSLADFCEQLVLLEHDS